MKLWSRLKIALGNISDDRLKILLSPIVYGTRFVPTCGDSEELDRILSSEIKTSEMYRLSDEEHFEKIDEIMRKHGYTYNEFFGAHKDRVYFKDMEVVRAQEART